MNPPAKKVKRTSSTGTQNEATTGRAYDGRRRREQAERTRDAVLDAALERFVLRGYGATTIADVAAAAGVSVETVYKRFRNKAGLVRAIRDRALIGSGAVPAEARSDALHVEHDDPRAIIEGWGRLTAEVAPRVAPILLVVRDAAAVDPDLVSLRDELDAARLQRMGDNARRLAERGHLRAGVTETEARDVMFAATAPELYELLVLRQGWSAERYGAFVADAMLATLVGGGA
jgi:AcrR family transcriptional regulator